MSDEIAFKILKPIVFSSIVMTIPFLVLYVITAIGLGNSITNIMLYIVFGALAVEAITSTIVAMCNAIQTYKDRCEHLKMNKTTGEKYEK